jgi:hypothetical protein
MLKRGYLCIKPAISQNQLCIQISELLLHLQDLKTWQQCRYITSPERDWKSQKENPAGKY